MSQAKIRSLLAGSAGAVFAAAVTLFATGCGGEANGHGTNQNAGNGGGERDEPAISVRAARLEEL